MTEDKRSITRLRETFVKERTRTGCQIKSLLFQHGLIGASDDSRVSEKWIKQLKPLELNPGLRFALDHYIAMWCFLNTQIKEIDEEMELQAQGDNDLEAIYRSVPGVGPVAARVLANELEDIQHFNNERQLFSYVGLTPSEHSSGEHIRQGHITRQGKPILRKILVQVSWRAIFIDDSLAETFDRLAQKVGKKRAIIGIARRLIGRIRSCFRTGELYALN